ncbi:MAG TPA: retroviral-like aspartic protease family protein [Myxococcota bacterium]
MRMSLRYLCAGALCALLGASGARAEIYRWTDAEGHLHFTENLDQVPLQYRERARRGAESPPPSKLQTYSTPTRDPATAQGARYGEQIRIPFVRDGSLMRVDVQLNDQLSAPFLVDTGASGISLPSHVAEQLGVRIRSDTPHVNVVTAAGVVARPVVTLQSVQLGRARVEGLEATVNPAMQVGLLGGTFFNNFVYQVDAAAGEILLVPNERIRGGLDEEGWRARFRSLRDPIERLDAYLASGEVVRQAERERLERNRAVLSAELEELERHANRLDVPQAWRQ